MTFTFRSLRTVLAVSALAVLAAGLITAQAHGRPDAALPQDLPPPPHAMMMMRMLDHVDATDVQRAEIKRIMADLATDMDQRRAAENALRQQAVTVFTQPTVDAAAAEALRQKMVARHEQASRRMLQTALALSQVLTAEQRQQLAQQMAAVGPGPRSAPPHAPGS